MRLHNFSLWKLRDEFPAMFRSVCWLVVLVGTETVSTMLCILTVLTNCSWVHIHCSTMFYSFPFFSSYNSYIYICTCTIHIHVDKSCKKKKPVPCHMVPFCPLPALRFTANLMLLISTVRILRLFHGSRCDVVLMVVATNDCYYVYDNQCNVFIW